MKLYYAPISTYSNKAVIAAHEKNVKFEPCLVDLMNPEAHAKYKEEINPMGKVPTLVLDDGWKIPESSIIVEYLDTHFDTGTKLIPDDKDLARQTRFHDCIGDLYLVEPAGRIVLEGFKPEAEQDKKRTAEHLEVVQRSLGLMERFMDGKQYVVNDEFGFGDIAPAIGCNIARGFLKIDLGKNTSAWLERCNGRESFQKVQAESAPYIQKMMGG